MVQSIYNNYSPQYLYNNVKPNQVNQPIGYNTPSFLPVYQPTTMAVADQFVQSTPIINNQNQSNPDTRAVTQNIFNQPHYNQAYYTNPQTLVPQIIQPQNIDYCPWVKDSELKFALNKLAEVTHTPQDMAQLKAMGINPPFNNGKEAIDFISQNQIKVEFGDMGDSLAHAQYRNSENKIIINKNYQGKMTLPMALAIADAIYHEAGHSKDRDGYSSIQEELDCLALNVLGYRHQERAYPHIINNSGEQSRLISDGVALYPKLFFDNDQSKQALINRVSEKYGFLPMTSPNHDITQKPMALKIKESFIDSQNVKKA